MTVAFPVKAPNLISPNGGLNPSRESASSCVIGGRLRTEGGSEGERREREQIEGERREREREGRRGERGRGVTEGAGRDERGRTEGEGGARKHKGKEDGKRVSEDVGEEREERLKQMKDGTAYSPFPIVENM